MLQKPVRGSRDMSAREARVRATVKPQRPAGAVAPPEMADTYLANEFEEYPDDYAAGDFPATDGNAADFRGRPWMMWSSQRSRWMPSAM